MESSSDIIQEQREGTGKEPSCGDALQDALSLKCFKDTFGDLEGTLFLGFGFRLATFLMKKRGGWLLF